MGVHDGHRERMKRRFLENGLDNFYDHEALELLLYFSVPRQDTNPIAHRLLDAFEGSLSAVFDAPIEELMKVSGVGGNTALLLKLVPELHRRRMLDRCMNDPIICSTEAAGEFFISRFFGQREELVYLACLDAKSKLLSCPLLYRGNVNSAQISVRKIVSAALASNATFAILAHNHPSGIATPSDEDLRTTRLVYSALKSVSVELVDHLIVADEDFVSLAQDGFFDTLR